jgi:hypothetical protein
MRRLLFSAIIFIPVALSAATPAKEITYLLNRVEKSTLTFVRNGEPHSGMEAARHMRRKANYFGGRIKTAEDFIAKAGSKSGLTGNPYLVRISSRTEIRCDAWLEGLLRDFRNTAQ